MCVCVCVRACVRVCGITMHDVCIGGLCMTVPPLQLLTPLAVDCSYRYIIKHTSVHMYIVPTSIGCLHQ